MPGVALDLVALDVLFLALTLAIAVQGFRVVSYGHRTKSFQMGFLVLGGAWSALRATFFTAFLIYGGELGELFSALTYWTPPCFEFATFSLLSTFYAVNITLGVERSGARARARVQRYKVAYVVANTVLFALSSAWIVVSLTSRFSTDQLLTGRLIATAVAMSALVAVLAVFSWRFFKLLIDPTVTLPYQQRMSATKEQIKVMVALLLLLFLSRVCYDIASAFNAVHVTFDAEQTNLESLIAVAAFVAWEIVPITIVLFMFRNIPKPAPALHLTSHMQVYAALPPHSTYAPLHASPPPTPSLATPQHPHERSPLVGARTISLSPAAAASLGSDAAASFHAAASPAAASSLGVVSPAHAPSAAAMSINSASPDAAPPLAPPDLHGSPLPAGSPIAVPTLLGNPGRYESDTDDGTGISVPRTHHGGPATPSSLSLFYGPGSVTPTRPYAALIPPPAAANQSLYPAQPNNSHSTN